MEQPVDIQIFGRTLRINCPEEKRAELNRAAKYLEKQLQELKERTKISNVEQLLFISALNICYDLNQEKAKFQNYTVSIDRGIQSLKDTVSRAISEHNTQTLQTNNIKKI
ncbi:protein that localizes to the cytokinetic ring [Wigglesworthia glossinidia endosymbiont of Glossina morsitans morsitans (Yale colony)]|uniref:Cell division protein ZapA n=2 Tax=Wigglesworthia glossinidia TaxID=51229 RepID=H6Q5W7_WIGGL|nr:protein that localizes to the cytokinetic ring [Wigglesworthia glossinidia endosymbiont of Glossina morsitans morsitans (Yale colony)]